MSRVLDVYLHDNLAGKLIQEDTGKLSFTYDEQYLQKNLPAISLSLPHQSEPYPNDVTRAYFSGFLPDDTVRRRLARYLGVSEKNPFALLAIIGGECAGALSLYPEGVDPQEDHHAGLEILDDQKLGEVLELLKQRPLLAGEEGVRLSLAGAQNKMAVVLTEGHIAIAKGSTPTTHILKPVIEDIEESVQNELFCMRLAAMIGLPTPAVEIRWADDKPFYLVERYDRTKDTSGIVKRLHQEDFCQASGVMPDVKYQVEGGPGISACQGLISQFSYRPAVDNLRFLDQVIFNFLIGNADAHGKNFSFLYRTAKPELSPVYDLMSTAVYETLSDKMAMKIGGKYKPEEVFRRHWNKLVPETKVAHRNLEKKIETLSEDCCQLARELRVRLLEEGISSPVFLKIETLIKQRAEQILK